MSVGNSGQDVLEVGLWVEAIELCRGHDGIDGCGSFPPGVGTDEEIIASADSIGALRICGNVVICLEPAVGQEACKLGPPAEDVAECLGEVQLGRQPVE